MKKSDIAMVIFIASISVFVSFFVAKSFFGGVYEGTSKVMTVDAISSSIEEPSIEIFNKEAINPSVQIKINGTDPTTKPGS